MRTHTLLTCTALALLGAACSDDGIDSNEEARRAYLGLHPSIEKSLNLGFDGFNNGSNANIDPQVGEGDDTGSLTITGQVDRGNSANKEMRLYVGMVDYSEGVFTVVYDDDEEVEVDLTYDTSEVETEQPYLHLSLRDFPDGTFTGELTGTYSVSGDIEADVTLTLTMAGDIMAGDVEGQVLRVPETTTVTGTATSGDGTYDVDLTL